MQVLTLLWWRIRYAFWHLSWRVMFRIAEWRTLHGIRVGAYAAREAQVQARLFEKIDAALGLMAAYEPRRIQRMARDIRRVWVWRDAYAAAYYLQALDMCVIDLKFLIDDQTTEAAVAAVLVHEVTHARLMKCGIPYSEAARSRIEEICVAESASFARRLPGGEALATHLRDCLPSDVGHWSDQRLKRRLVDANLQELDEVILPNWLKRFLRRIIVSRAA